MLADMCEFHRGVYCVCVGVSKWERVSAAGGRNLWLFQEGIKLASLSHVERVFFTLFFLSSFFSVSSWFIAQVVFHPIHSSVPAYLLCVPTDGFVRLYVCWLSCLDLAISLCFAEVIPAVCVTLFATGLSPEHVCFSHAQWLPVDASVAWQKFRAHLDGHIRWRQISPRDAVLAHRFCS